MMTTSNRKIGRKARRRRPISERDFMGREVNRGQLMRAMRRGGYAPLLPWASVAVPQFHTGDMAR